MERHIYHLVSDKEFKKLSKDGYYTPSNYQNDGFIHCSGETQVLPVAEAYYSGIDDLLLLKLDCSMIDAEVKYENPAPVDGFKNDDGSENEKFPHIYGPLNLSAVKGIAKMIEHNGRFEWPVDFSYTI